MNGNWEPVIGIEVHVQLATRTKAFCRCLNQYGADPNTLTCPVCLALPGALPVLQEGVVDFAVRIGCALDFQVNTRSVFARKNYFYPDLPKGYQISQYERPICSGGRLPIERADGSTKWIGITRAHLEEDTGKSFHGSEGESLLDLNRAGVPLLEIVSEPDIADPAEAYAYLSRLKSVLLYLGVTTGNMEEGALRADANISLRPKGEAKFGTKIELKNLNSFRNVQRALEFEMTRQAALLDAGETLRQETRLWDEHKGETTLMRVKETESDYRYFPEPDLPHLVLDEARVAKQRGLIPELPHARKARYAGEWKIPADSADLLSADRALSDYFEAAVAACGNPVGAANWTLTELNRVLNDRKAAIGDSPVSAQQLAGLVKLIDTGKISGKQGKELFAKMAETSRDPAELAKEMGLEQVSDEGAIGAVIDEILAANAGQVEQYRAGSQKVFGFFVGQVMKKMKGQGNPAVVNQILRKKLDG